MALGKLIILPNILCWLSAKPKLFFPLLPSKLCRVSLTDTRQSANGRALQLAAVARPAHVLVFCRVPDVCRVFRYYLPSVYFKALGKESFCRVQYVSRMFPRRHSAHSRFECPMECTRETLRHSSYLLFLVVHVGGIEGVWC